MSLEHALLGFLSYSPMTGYELKQHFDQSIYHFWNANLSQIYPALSRMKEEGLLTMEVEHQEDRPNRKVYTITDAGREALQRWLVTPLPPGQVREAWLIQIFFAHFQSNDEIVSLLEARMDAMRARLAVCRTEIQAAIDQNAAQSGVERASQLWQITLDYGIAHYETQLAWLEQTLARVRKLPPLTPPKP
ncbi:MAG: PadR family transcriptional regulator [Chloroflexi bacterium HGW-Chloroflexi-1]|nr:MAG: PadR family transcriptional regulator [Chloroflexi bacterium HGW-Chloroflexi-1]